MSQEDESQPEDNTQDDEQRELIFKFLSNTVAYVTNEALVVAQYEMVRPGVFGNLWTKNDNSRFDKRMNEITEHLGGPPRFYIMKEESEPPPADLYPEAALGEAVDMFARARKSVLRAHMFETGSSLLAKAPELMDLSTENGEADMFISRAQGAFWEHAETAYIRLYSFWDRLGQLLDFAFFNIRKFDQNGFYAVIERINANVIPMDESLKKSGPWKRVRSFQSSEKDDGLKWLLMRRNLIVHSLHLHPIRKDEEGVFKSQFNHLEASHREKLRPRDPAGEVALLVGQLNQAIALFNDVLSLIERTPSRRVDNFL